MRKERRRQRILVVDDNKEVVDMLGNVLHRMGYNPVTCTKPLEALILFCDATERFDAVILDEMMPEIRGTEIAERLIQVRHDIPIILITGRGEELTIDHLMKSGVRATLIKPVLRETLRTTLERALKPRTQEL